MYTLLGMNHCAMKIPNQLSCSAHHEISKSGGSTTPLIKLPPQVRPPIYPEYAYGTKILESFQPLFFFLVVVA